MELKFHHKIRIQTSLFRSNRTFMELKSQKYKEIQLANDVLIAPLWN